MINREYLSSKSSTTKPPLLNLPEDCKKDENGFKPQKKIVLSSGISVKIEQM